MIRLILVRHANTTFTEEGRYQGHRDEPLSDAGRVQARTLGERLRAAWAADLERAAIHTSDLVRARETLWLALGRSDAIVDARLRELRFGAFEGFTAAELELRAPIAFRGWLDAPDRHAPPEGETLAAFEQRLRAWLHGLPRDRAVVAFTHGGAMRMLIALTMQQPFATVRAVNIAPTDAARLLLWPDFRTLAREIEWLRSEELRR